MRAMSFALVLIACALLGATCVTVRIVSFPPPEDPCPTEEDVETLAGLLPQPEDLTPREAVRVEELGQKFIGAAGYCQAGEERLR